MKYLVTEQIESPNKVNKHIEVKDFFFVLAYIGVTIAFMDYVHEALKVIYFMFSLSCSIFLTTKSAFNKRRRNYESIFLLLARDENVYMPIYGGKEDEN